MTRDLDASACCVHDTWDSADRRLEESKRTREIKIVEMGVHNSFSVSTLLV